MSNLTHFALTALIRITLDYNTISATKADTFKYHSSAFSFNMLILEPGGSSTITRGLLGKNRIQ